MPNIPNDDDLREPSIGPHFYTAFIYSVSPFIVHPLACLSSCASLDNFRNRGPYRIKRKGIGNKAAATAPIIDTAGPTSNALIIGLVAKGSPAVVILRRNVTAAVELAA